MIKRKRGEGRREGDVRDRGRERELEKEGQLSWGQAQTISRDPVERQNGKLKGIIMCTVHTCRWAEESGVLAILYLDQSAQETSEPRYSSVAAAAAAVAGTAAAAAAAIDSAVLY